MKMLACIAAWLFAVAFGAAEGSLPFAVEKSVGGGRPCLCIAPPHGIGAWDLSGVGEVRVALSNATDQAQRVRVAVFGDGMSSDGDGRLKAPWRATRIPPGGVRMIVVPLNDTPYATDSPVDLEGMLGKVPSLGDLPDFSRTGRIEVSADVAPSPSVQVAAGRILPVVLGVDTAFVARRPKVIPSGTFFPFVDRYGQFRHDEWPGKIHSDAELAEARDAEEAWLAANAAGPVPNADRFGGWADGPQLAATGFFRTEKVDGRWWFVNPDGHLFWSLGVCSVYPGLPTRVAGRESFFECRSDAAEAWPLRENLKRKYGDGWRARHAGAVHRRFRAWGLNTIGNWNHDCVWESRRTPYCACIDFSSRTVLPTWNGSKAHGRAVPDVFSPRFAEDIAAAAAILAAKIKDDPWCLGVFVDNELGWDGCGTNVAAVAEAYYSTIRAALKEAMPNHLYLGSRIHNDFGEIDSVWLAAARHCDVVSANHYDLEPSCDLPRGAPDKPLLIGEFHFCTGGRGQFSHGLVHAFGAEDRAARFRHYVETCLDDPRYVGCHWFQYQDQPLTGRFDGENFPCGFVSICDVPYPELVGACRETAAAMYQRHSESSAEGLFK